MPKLGWNHSEETRAKMSVSHLGVKLPESTKLAMSIAAKNKIFTDEHRRNISLSLMGKKRSERSRRLQSERQKGKPSPRKGCKLSPEHIEKLAASHRGKPIAEETRRKLSDTHKRLNSVARLRTGKPVWNKGQKGMFNHTAASREKISLTMKQKGIRPVSVMSGDKHYKWKGGITPENLKIRNSVQYDLWRNAVFARDNWTCQKYQIKGCVLRAHHIQSFHAHPELRFAIDNGITLSDRAHMEFHNKYGRRNNTAEQLKEFLSAP